MHRGALTDGAPPGSADATVADDFEVKYFDTFKVVRTFCGTHQPDSCVPKTYVLSLCGAPHPTAYPDGRACRILLATSPTALRNLVESSGTL